MIALVLLLVAVPGEGGFARCLARLEAAVPSSTSAPERDQLMRAAQRFELCGIEGWARAERLETAPPAPPAISEVPLCTERPLWLDLLSHLGAATAGGAIGYSIAEIRK